MKRISCLRKTARVFILGCSLTVLAVNPVFGNTGSARLQWDPNQENDIHHYRVYQGTASGVYSGYQDVGLQTEFTAANLDPSETHYFVVTAWDTAGQQSPPSDEVFKAFTGGGGGVGSFPPSIAEPVPGSTLTSATVTFKGGHTSQDLEHWLWVGSSAGTKNLHNSGSLGTGHTRVVSGLPTSGKIYVQWWTRNSSGWHLSAHTYTMNVDNGGGTGGGSSFPAPIVDPKPGSQLTSSTVTFKGGQTSQDLEHWLYVGTSIGAKDIYNSKSMGTEISRTVSGLPNSGTIYVRWWSRNSSGWKSQDHTYNMSVGGGTISFPPPVVQPVPGTTLTSTSVTFTGGHTSQDLEHWLYVGTSIGSKDIYNSASMGTEHSRTVVLPKTGTIYVRWWSRNSSGWKKQDHSFTMNAGN